VNNQLSLSTISKMVSSGKMKTNIIMLIWVCQFVLSFCIESRSQEIRFKTLTVNDGLTQNDVSCIFQDSFGFIWIGTYDGLNRFDGLNIKNFSSKTDNEESLSSNRITCLFEDSQKRLWIGTDGSGLNYFSLISEKFIRVDTPPEFNLIHSIAENSNGDIFIAANNGVLKIVENKKPSLEIVQLPITGLSIRKVLTTSDNSIYFGTNQGIWVWRDSTCIQLKENKNVLFSDLIEDKDHKIWAAGYQKLCVIQNQDEKIAVQNAEDFETMDIRALCKTQNGDIWIGTLNSGLFELDISAYKIKNKYTSSPTEERSLLSNTVLSLFLDDTNTLWIGNRQGLCFTSLSNKKFYSLPIAELKKISIRPLIRNLDIDGSDIFIASQNNGCFLYSLETMQICRVTSENEILANNFCKISDRMYIAASDGVYVQTTNNLSFSKLSFNSGQRPADNQNVHVICEDAYGNIYFGTEEGLIIQKKDLTHWIHDEYEQASVLRGKRIFSLYHDKAGNCVWVGTISEGLFKLNLTDSGDYLSIESFKQSMQNNYYIASNTIWCFYKDDENTLWVGTDAGLLMKSEKSGKFVQIKTDGVLDKKIVGIEKDGDGNLWLANSQGLICFNPLQNKVRNYTYEDGLNSSTLTEAVGKTANGVLFFGSINGINYFKPSEIKVNPYEANVAISDFRVHNKSIIPDQTYWGSMILDKSINMMKEIKLNYRQNDFIFEFAGTNYANASENMFQYKLEGYDTEWIYTNGTHRFAPYSNLKSGTYTLWINAANHDGIWSDTPKTLTINILPPPWLSGWAYLIYFLFSGSILWSFIYFMRNKQKLKHQIELDIVERKKDKEINELKLTFFTDIAHEFKTPLSLIIGPLNDLTESKITNKQRDFCYYIVSRNVKRLMFLVNQLLDFRKINADKNILKVSENDLALFLKQTTEAFLWQAESEEINFNIIIPDSLECFFDKDIIEKVIYNLLSNAFKFTPKNGIVEIELKQIWKKNKQIATITIKDSGRGIPDNQKALIFERYVHGKDRSSSGIGLHLSYQLIQAHKGEINVADSYYGGAEFIVNIPVSKSYYNLEDFFETADSKIPGGEALVEFDKPKKEIAEERERILIVEDDHDLRAYLKNCLQQQYSTFEAVNGLEGIEQAKMHLPDIIISDVMMPEMDGIEMCRNLRKNNLTSHIPILMLTAMTDDEHIKKGLEAGAWDYITKPFNTHALLKKIDNIIETRNNFKEFLINQHVTLDIKKHYAPFDQRLITKIAEIVEKNISNSDFSVENLASEIGLSRMQLHRKLKTLVGQSTTSFIIKIKMRHAKNMFDLGCDRINEAMDAVGISSYSYFYTSFKKVIGKTAKEYISEIKSHNHSELPKVITNG
jgi:signal transduction histidine kinase/ligand-binding sensor domain-containing protein/DNA-binding NarL/FixJ family response regulator